MPDQPGWDELFTPKDEGSSHGTAGQEQPQSRRAAKQARGAAPKRPRRRRRWVAWVVSLAVVFGLLGGTAAYAWANFEPQIRSVLGWELPPPDYVGQGSGEATIVVMSGDTGVEVTNSLLEADVIKSFDTFYNLLLVQDPPVDFYPGYYVLAKKMSSAAALAAMQDPASRLERTALIQEGKSIDQVFDILSTATEVPVADFVAAAADPTSYGIAPEAPNLEGYLFAAKYTFDPGLDARTILTRLVDRTFQALDEAGVAPANRHKVLTLASVIQREAGSNTDDFYKVSRVFTNRLNEGWHLESDATVSYGTGRTHTVWTEPEERADASNPYNTYANPGLPIGPIGAVGDLAIDAALHPADGPWFYFVPINLETGETVFSETLEQHNAAVRLLHDWCESTQSPNCD